MSALLDNSDITSISIRKEMERSYLDYAMSVIVSRALPDVRDGLKPVHRRILFAMYESGCHYNRAYKKSARIVGEVMGKYHPHGDQAIYDALVRMAQDFSMRVTLVDGQGNFGSIDKDDPAAMRYTESRLEKITHTMLADLDKETVLFNPNYDNTEKEPSVLPVCFPNLLVNGSEGIAVGMATSIPPHNLGEVINATIAQIHNPNITTEELITYIPAPDFPTAGIIMSGSGVRQMYETGRGSVKLRGRAAVEELKGDRQRIVISQIPYQVVKSTMVENIADLVRDKKIEGISDIRDESSKDGIRVVIDLKRGFDGNIILNQLYKMTQLQVNVSANILALHHGRPQQMGLKVILAAFIEFREEVISKRTKYLLDKAKNKAHILIGLTVAVDFIDEIVTLIRSSGDYETAKTRLLERQWEATKVIELVNMVGDRRNKIEKNLFKFTHEQVKAILEMRLSKLTGLERDSIVSELKDLSKEIGEYIELLSNRQKFITLMISELEDIKNNFATARLSEISFDDDDIDIEDLIQKEDVIISYTLKGYIKKDLLSSYNSQRRGGKGKKAMRLADEDCIIEVFPATTHSFVLFFTDKGKVYQLKAYKIPSGDAQSKGRAIVNLLNINEDEKINNFLAMPEKKADWKDYSLIFATKNGLIRKSPISEFETINSSGKIAIGLNDDDELIGVRIAKEDDHIVLATYLGQAVRFTVGSLRTIKSRNSQGVKGAELENGDRVISLSIIGSSEKDIQTRDKFLDIPLEVRATLKDITDDAILINTVKDSTVKIIDLAPHVIREWSTKEEFILTVTENGYGKRSSAYEYRITSRGSKGVRNIITSERNGNVSATFIVHDAEDIIIITSTGKMVRFNAKQISIVGRSTQGVRLINIDGKNEKVVSVAKVAGENDGDTIGDDLLEGMAEA